MIRPERNDGRLVVIFNYHASSCIISVDDFQLLYTANNTDGAEL
jgi:hypothetical protein